MAAKYKCEIVRVVYERGIETRRVGGQLVLQSVESTRAATANPETINPITLYNVRPILHTERFPDGKERTLFLPKKDTRISGEGHIFVTYLGDIENRRGLPLALEPDIRKHLDPLMYLAFAICYHCEQLAEAYALISRTQAEHRARFRDRWGEEPPDIKRDFYDTYEPRVWYEFDALITAAMRLYEAMRFLVFAKYGKGLAIPEYFKELLSKAEYRSNLPAAVVQRLDQSWSQFGSKLRDYRVCITHYVPLKRPGWTAILTRLPPDPPGVWSTSVWLPENPEARSVEKFRFVPHLDALTYGWDLTHEMVDVLGEIVDAIVADLRK